MTRKQKRLSVIGGGLFVLAVAAALVLFALQQKIAFFRMPSDIQTSDVELEFALPPRRSGRKGQRRARRWHEDQFFRHRPCQKRSRNL